ncbi:AAA family ATPase [Metabacillus arenae]|uniref:ATP-binding protein n=1 Tax=Metabacillus arenae TaxID=2771434 RepID=A0A926S3Q8_9BACI|nr:AAA family ATPase [Metabacillus arenae]MBD1383209.1 ATP-binding protein [Metabacillus arenae]
MKPQLIFLIGCPGSGKSTIGKAISKEFNFSYIDKDITCNLFTGTLLEMNGYSRYTRDHCDFYKDIVMDLEYQTIMNVANENLKLGNSVILDAPFLSYFADENYLSDLQTKYRWHDIDPLVLNVTVDFEILKERLQKRGLERDQWKFNNWARFIKDIQLKKCLWNNVTIKEFDNSKEELNTEELYQFFRLRS